MGVFIIRLKQISAKCELQKEQLSGANKSIETMRAELAAKNKEVETCNKRYKPACNTITIRLYVFHIV